MEEKAAMQAAYEATRAHYAAGNPTATDGVTCVYKVIEEKPARPGREALPLGAQCAVGCRISNALARQLGGWDTINSLGSLSALYDEEKRAKLLVPFFGEQGSALYKFNARIQGEHDGNNLQTPAELVERLDALARNFGLDPAPAVRAEALDNLSSIQRWALGV